MSISWLPLIFTYLSDWDSERETIGECVSPVTWENSYAVFSMTEYRLSSHITLIKNKLSFYLNTEQTIYTRYTCNKTSMSIRKTEGKYLHVLLILRTTLIPFGIMDYITKPSKAALGVKYTTSLNLIYLNNKCSIKLHKIKKFCTTVGGETRVQFMSNPV